MHGHSSIAMPSSPKKGVWLIFICQGLLVDEEDGFDSNERCSQKRDEWCCLQVTVALHIPVPLVLRKWLLAASWALPNVSRTASVTAFIMCTREARVVIEVMAEGTSAAACNSRSEQHLNNRRGLVL
jgi:hypothetical protein